MRLTKTEQEMADGKHGEAVQKAMELLVALGECFDADQMVQVTSAHLVSANPINAGRGGTQFIREMARKGGQCVISTSTNPASLEPWSWKEMGFSRELHNAHIELSKVLTEMGVFLSGTCTPYLIGHAPRVGEHVAWGESSAVVYANSVLGARTNRQGGAAALAAGLTGRAPAFGYHLDENRYGTLKIVVNTELKNETHFAFLGYFAGKIARDRVPIITGVRSLISRDELKCLGAASAVSGSVAMYHMVGVTPEARTEEIASGGKKITSSDTFEFGSAQLKGTEESLAQIGPEEADLVILGCPHASMTQIQNYAKVFSNRKVKSDIEVWILISHVINTYAQDTSYADILKSAGVKLVSNTCPAGMPRDFFKKRGYRTVATDSPKMAYYTSTTQNIPCYCGSLEKFLNIMTIKK